MLDLLERDTGECDYRTLVESLAPEQAVALNIVLQGSTQQRVLPLRAALSERLLSINAHSLRRINDVALRAFFNRPPTARRGQHDYLRAFDEAAAKPEQGNGYRPRSDKPAKIHKRWAKSAAFWDGGIDPKTTGSRPKTRK